MNASKKTIKGISLALKSLLLTGSLGLFIACEQVVPVDIPLEPSRLVVNSLFNTDSLWLVEVSASKHVLDQADYTLVDNATITLHSNGTASQDFLNLGQGIYVAPTIAPEPGTEYRIEVTAPSYSQVSAFTTMPNTIPIEVFAYDTARINPEGEYFFAGEVTFTDPPGKGDAYELQGWYWYPIFDGFTVFDSVRVEAFITTDDPIVPEDQRFIEGGGLRFNDDFIDGRTYTLNVWLPRDIFLYQVGDFQSNTLELQLRHLDEHYFLYQLTVDQQRQASGDPFAEPVQIYNNIADGFGIFGSYTPSTHRYVLD